MPRDVRSHTRRTTSGRTTRVREHTRRGNTFTPAKPKKGPNPHHAGKMVRRALAHGRRGRKGKAVIFAALCGVELVLWLAFNGVAGILMMAAALLFGLSLLLTK